MWQQIPMPRYYFDTQDGDYILCDDDGVELPGLDMARAEAARTVAEMARDILPGQECREIAVEVLDEARRPLFRAALWFEIEKLAS
jgi:hypothetical protein